VAKGGQLSRPDSSSRANLLQPLQSNSQDDLSQLHVDDSCANGTPVCFCCSDHAVAARVLTMLPGGMASVDLDGTIDEVSVELIDSAPGDMVLVHARVAIARLSGSA